MGRRKQSGYGRSLVSVDFPAYGYKYLESKEKRVYNVAYVDDDKCVAEKGCRLCIMYCPESDCILLDPEKQKAFVVTDRCKGCDLCKVVCSTHEAITMYPVNGATGEILLGEKAGQAAELGQAYAG